MSFDDKFNVYHPGRMQTLFCLSELRVELTTFTTTMDYFHSGRELVRQEFTNRYLSQEERDLWFTTFRQYLADGLDAMCGQLEKYMGLIAMTITHPKLKEKLTSGHVTFNMDGFEQLKVDLLMLQMKIVVLQSGVNDDTVLHEFIHNKMGNKMKRHFRDAEERSDVAYCQMRTLQCANIE